MNISAWKKAKQESFAAGARWGADPLGDLIFVDSVNGNDGNDGYDKRRPKATLTAAVAAAESGDTIIARGSFSEAVVVSTTNLRIVGAGSGPKECQWTSGADTISLTISANYVEVRNIYFKPPAYSAGTPAAIKLSNANWARIIGCRFQGQTASHNAIHSPVCNSDNVHILDCEFHYMNTATYGAAILGVEAGGLSYSAWVIERCTFKSCVTAININGRVCVIKDCVVSEYGINAAGSVAAVCTTGIHLDGTSSGGNTVVGCQLSGDYSTAGLYKPGASGDVWVGNFAEDTAETEVADNGITVANPAA